MPLTLTYDIPRRRGEWTKRWLPVAASQTWNLGDPLSLDANGRVIRSAANNAAITDAQRPIGLAGSAASGLAQGTLVEVEVPEFSGEFRVPVNHATPASAVTALTQVGETADTAGFQLFLTSAGILTVRIDNTTNPVVDIRKIDDTFPVGEQFGFVWVRPILTAWGNV